MTILNVVNDTIVIDKLALSETQGSIQHLGDIAVDGNVHIESNLRVVGTITADTFNVKNLITDNGSLEVTGNWMYNSEAELNGKGFNWTWGEGSTQLAYRLGGRLWTNSNFDLDTGKTFNIQNIPVLSLTTLGGTVVSSNLQRVGKLASLTVLGDTVLGDFVHINGTYNRIGIGTDEPSASLSILDNNVEISIGSDRVNQGFIGTSSNHNLELVTDSTARVIVKANGEVIVGDELNKTGVLRVYGSLYVDNLVTDTRLDRSSSLEFKGTANNSIFGLGLSWTGVGATRQLMMRSGPDRLWTSESFDLAEDQSFYINNEKVLSATSLGHTVTQSNLTKVGTLDGLSVMGQLSVSESIATQSIEVDNGLTINGNIIQSMDNLAIKIQESNALYADADAVVIGDKTNIRKPVKVFGPLSVKVSNPDPTVNFTVSGDVSIGDKRFTKGRSAPAVGTFAVGDICWNTNPAVGHPIGWVCLGEGSPGNWAPFGQIS